MRDSQLRVLLDGQDVSSAVDDDLTWSSVDGGGFEAASLSFPRRVSVRKGAPARVELGLETAWEGRVAESGQTLAGGAKTSVACEGHGARLKEALVSEIYVDRDLTRWRGASAQRKINLAGTFRVVDPAVQADSTTGRPGVRTAVASPWAGAPALPLSEAWYDGGGIAIGSVRYAWRRGATVDNTNTNWTWEAHLTTDDVLSSADSTGSLRAVGPGSGTLSATGTRRFAALQLWYAAANGNDGIDYPIDWDSLAVYGRHGLPQRTLAGAPPGLLPDDVARHALTASGAGIDAGVFEAAPGFVVPQAVYRSAAAELVVAEMAQLAGGFHWGTWDAGGPLGGRPRLDFRALPAAATAFVSRADCDDLQLAERLGDLYDRVLVGYDDPAGGAKTVERTRPVPELAEADVGGRTLAVAMGTGTLASAETFGDFVLALSERKARAAGTAQVSGMVGVPGGGRRHAALLRPGIDKLRVTDLPGAPFLAPGRQEFQLQRVECRASREGVTTQLALGSGPDLLEVLQARLALATDAALFGAG